MSIYAGGKGFLDDLEIKDVLRFEREFLAWVVKEYSEIPLEIAKSRDLSKETEAKLEKALTAFKAAFVRSAAH